MNTTPLDEYYLKQPELVRECLWALKSIVLQINPCITHRRMYQIPFFFYKDVKIAFLWVKQKKVYFGLVKDKRIYGASKDEVEMVEINPSEDIPKDYICETTGLLIAECEK